MNSTFLGTKLAIEVIREDPKLRLDKGADDLLSGFEQTLDLSLTVGSYPLEPVRNQFSAIPLTIQRNFSEFYNQTDRLSRTANAIQTERAAGHEPRSGNSENRAVLEHARPDKSASGNALEGTPGYPELSLDCEADSRRSVLHVSFVVHVALAHRTASQVRASYRDRAVR